MAKDKKSLAELVEGQRGEEPATTAAEPQAPAASMEELAAENQRLRDKIARLQADSRKEADALRATIVEVRDRPRPNALHEQGLYRVSLEGCKVLVKDEEGRPRMQEHLDVEAISPADAFEKFKVYNGITATVR